MSEQQERIELGIIRKSSVELLAVERVRLGKNELINLAFYSCHGRAGKVYGLGLDQARELGELLQKGLVTSLPERQKPKLPAKPRKRPKVKKPFVFDIIGIGPNPPAMRQPKMIKPLPEMEEIQSEELA